MASIDTMFRLDGKATAPAYPAATVSTFRAARPSASAKAIEQGRIAYGRDCSVCHGPSAMGGVLPDLRRSPAIATREAFNAIVLDGALKDNGMISFAPILTPARAEDIRAYVLRNARRAQARGEGRGGAS